MVGIILGVIIGTSLLVLVLACRKRSVLIHLDLKVLQSAWAIMKYVLFCRRRHNASNNEPYRQTPYSPYGPDSNYNSSALLSTKWPPTPSTTTRTSGYAHIWELKNPPSILSSNVDAHGVAYVPDTLSLNPEAHEGTPRVKSNREHIYESPKFQRKDFADGSSMIGTVEYPTPGMIPYYHEFDPERPDRQIREMGHPAECITQTKCIDS